MSDIESPEFIRLIFSTLKGRIKCVEVDSAEIESIARIGYSFDGSSVPGYAKVNDSDLILRPVPSAPIIQGWDTSTAILLCSVYEINGKPHDNDPRNILTRMTKQAEEKGIRLKVGAELEFFMLKANGDNTFSPADMGGYYDMMPLDRGAKVRREIIHHLKNLGIGVVAHHHEVANGQHEICIRYDDAQTVADSIMLARIVITEVVSQYGMQATFMPKPFAYCNGSGLHLHQSLWSVDSGTNLFASDASGEVSQLARHYIAGVLEHARALTAVVASTVNSYKRLTPGFEAPTKIAWGRRNRSVMVRVPHFSTNSSARIEIRCPDPLCSPHLAMAAILAAGLDGIDRALEPPDELSENLFESGLEIASLPENLAVAISELSSDNVLKEAIGEATVKKIVALSQKDWNDYLESVGEHVISEISQWEIAKYCSQP